MSEATKTSIVTCCMLKDVKLMLINKRFEFDFEPYMPGTQLTVVSGGGRGITVYASN